jgi:hypothetical protein
LTLGALPLAGYCPGGSSGKSNSPIGQFVRAGFEPLTGVAELEAYHSSNKFGSTYLLNIN